MELIKAFLVSNEQIDQDAKRDPDTQTESIDERIHFALEYVARGYFKIVTDHKKVDSLNSMYTDDNQMFVFVLMAHENKTIILVGNI